MGSSTGRAYWFYSIVGVYAGVAWAVGFGNALSPFITMRVLEFLRFFRDYGRAPERGSLSLTACLETWLFTGLGGMFAAAAPGAGLGS